MNFTESVSLQPERLEAAIASTRQTLTPLPAAGWKDKRVAFVGIGASLYSAHVATFHFRNLGIAAYPFCASELLHEGPELADIFVVLSASGRSAEIFQSLDRMKGKPTIAISVARDNALAPHVDHVVETANPLDSSPSAPSFTATMVAIGLLAEAVSGQQSDAWSKLPSFADGVLRESRAVAADFATRMRGAKMIDLVGMGLLQGVAEEAGLLLREEARVPAAAFSTRNYLHGPMESMEAGNALVTLGGMRERKLAGDMAETGAEVWHLGCDEAGQNERGALLYNLPRTGNPLCDGLLHILPLHWLCAELSAIKELSDAPFRYRQSDTKHRP